MFWLRILLVILLKTYLIAGCKIPGIENGQVINSENGEVLAMGSDYGDFEAVSVKCSSGFSVFTIRPIDNEILCLPDDTWNQEFKKCQSSYFIYLAYSTSMY